MSEEEILRKKLDRIHENSAYGLNAADQAYIAQIIRDYIKKDIGNDYDIFNSPPPPIYIGPVKIKTLKERLEEMKMNSTSTQTFKDVIAIDFELQTFPNPDVDDKFIVSATNRDDIFCFVFEGPDLRDACRNAGLFTGWEKDQKIRELEKDKEKLIERNKDLEYLYDLERNQSVMIHGKAYNRVQMIDRILELENLKTPTIENFADEEPSDNVNHPSHYTGRYDCIDVMQDVFGDEATNDFCLCNAFKYIWRARKKNGLEDVKKAVWYLTRYIEEAEKDGVRKGEQV